MISLPTKPNPDLEIIDGNKSRWTHPDHRRKGFHSLHRLSRYGVSMRAARVMVLEKRMDLRIAELAALQQLTSLPWFSAMIVVQGPYVLFERYAEDFGNAGIHSIQSITKTLMNLVVGQLVERRVLDVSRKVSYYVPTIGSGYADATLQQVLDMDVVNDYTQDFADPRSSYYLHEEAMGWRLPLNPEHEETQRGFIAQIASGNTINPSGYVHYKDANTELLGWVVERASGWPMRSFIADIVDGAGLEGALHMTTDREGVPTLSGGACLTARDLARYFSIFVRGGRGIDGQMLGSTPFMERTLVGGVPMSPPNELMRYSNHTMVSGRTLCHGGWGGQFAVANLDTGAVAAWLSVVENEHALSGEYMRPVVDLLQTITAGLTAV